MDVPIVIVLGQVVGMYTFDLRPILEINPGVHGRPAVEGYDLDPLAMVASRQMSRLDNVEARERCVISFVEFSGHSMPSSGLWHHHWREPTARNYQRIGLNCTVEAETGEPSHALVMVGKTALEGAENENLA
jgi:hypothetical protein